MPGIYQDADLPLQTHAAEISSAMVSKVTATLNNIQWSSSDIADFLGTYLSEPKPNVFFAANKKISLSQFNKKILQNGIALDLKSQMLFSKQMFYLNGERVECDAAQTPLMQQLADERELNPKTLSDLLNQALLEKLHTWYLAGYIHVASDC
jgi:50S ribosomal protein L16 3-hydroxylase